jgi:hypothetical protein
MLCALTFAGHLGRCNIHGYDPRKLATGRSRSGPALNALAHVADE